jgi:MinD superfamily P-loop ATPase
MKQIAVISGKGGTGKTVITASLVALAEKTVIADCDVDAADLHLLLHPAVMERHEFVGGKRASIDQERCTGCGECVDVCRFNAISALGRGTITIDSISCEGCGVCALVCPNEAIEMRRHQAGEWFISETGYGFMVHARLGVAEENSGKLVATVRDKARIVAEQNSIDLVLIDGPPGIGCPVIASLSGVDIALIVTEPTLSGIHDLGRVAAVAEHFGVRATCVINKYDINIDNTNSIENWCRTENIPLLGKVPYDRTVPEALVKGIPPVECTHSPATREIEALWRNLTATAELKGLTTRKNCRIEQNSRFGSPFLVDGTLDD